MEWFSEREPAIALQARAADRKKLIAEQQKKGMLLAAQYREAVERAEANARVLAKAGDYPLLGGGDVNLYSLFVERAQALVNPTGVVALLTPSGIAADKGAAEFFKSIATTQRLGALFDFENKKVFFPDVHASFKFCTLVFGGGQRQYVRTRCAFYLHRLEELDDPERVLELAAADFALVNPNTGAAPIFRRRRDAEITTRLYQHPVLVRHGQASESLGQQPDRKVWPVKYTRMFDMTNDSGLFLTRDELVKRGFEPAPLNRWRKADKEAAPLYVGRMIHQFDHRHASVTINEDNLHNAALGSTLNATDKARSSAYPQPQYWVLTESVPPALRAPWTLGYRDIARATDVRTMIACITPTVSAGNTLPLLGSRELDANAASLVLANLNSIVFDYVARQKAQSTHLNWYILEQLPVIAPERFEASIGGVKIADFIREQVLHLSYTAHDLAPFARDLGHVDAQGEVLPPFVWNDEDRRARLAALDGLFFHLYGLAEDDAAYILDTFPIVREQDQAVFGRYRTKDDVLAQLRAIEGGSLRVA